jgi:NAD(P)-dependent dehydrogenase (short-subunit alcohol dehydrogenase family)
MSKNIVLIGFGLLGKIIYKELSNQNINVIIFDKNSINDKNFIEADITNEESLKKAIASLESKKIEIDHVINCAYPRTQSYGAKLEDVTVNSFNENVSVHLGGYFNVMKQFGFYFEKRKKGSVISFASVYGVVAPRFDIYEGMPFTMPVEYAAIKSAIIHLNLYMAKFFKGKGVRFNIISPGGIYDNHDSKFVKNYGKYSLSNEPGMLDPADILGILNLLTSDAGKKFNGQNLIVDEGWVL